jgi:hypothetical protein
MIEIGTYLVHGFRHDDHKKGIRVYVDVDEAGLTGYSDKAPCNVAQKLAGPDYFVACAQRTNKPIAEDDKNVLFHNITASRITAGYRRNQLTAVRFTRMKGRDSYWLWRCDCGTEKEILANSVLHDKTRSCGCLHRKTRHYHNDISKPQPSQKVTHEPAICAECGTSFVPKRRGTATCSRRCRQTRYQRRYYREHRGAHTQCRMKSWHRLLASFTTE